MIETLLTNEDLAAKVEWEGGVAEAISYGIDADQLVDPEVAALWQRAIEQFEALRQTTAQINEAIGLDYEL